jgi:hypothetical protein
MQSDDEDFEESLETLTPDRKIQSPGDQFPLRRTPARKELPTAQRKMDQQNLFEGLLTKRPAEATFNPNAAGFIYGGMSSSSYVNHEELHVEREGG